MATKYWYTPAGGDWYSGTWYVSQNNQLTASTLPVSGDQVQLFNGPVTLSAADFTTYGALSGLDIILAGSSSLSIASGTISATTTIELVYSNAPGVVNFAGTTHFGGMLYDHTGGVAMGLTIQAAGTLNLLSTSRMLALNAGTINVTGGTGAQLINAGTIKAGYALSATSFQIGVIDIATDLTNSGIITDTNFGTLSLLGQVTNTGTITNAGGTITFGGNLVNNGLVADNTGVMSIAGNVVGIGTIAIGVDQTLSIGGSVQYGETISFVSNVGTLVLNSPKDFGGTVLGMTGHDVIDLMGLANATVSISGNTVSILSGGAEVGRFYTTGLTGTLNTVSDNNGGTFLTLEQPGTAAAVVNTIVNGATGTGTKNWGAGGTIVTYSFNSASSWTTAEQQAFINGLGLWSAVANITFTPATSGTGQLIFTRGTDGQAYANATYNPATHIIQAETVSIDTNVGSWQNLSGIGPQDTTGFGGYGWSTVLHEIGHVLGLNHPGNYDETANLATQQTYFTDTHQYSVMSYFDAAQSGANWTSNGTAYNAETPMLFDIAAAQSIYGANTTTLAGHDIFGFNASASITGNAALNAVYNFSINTLPIVTIWDAGTNNTLDLSGTTTADVVNLNAGAFSSIDGLTDNLAIAYGTRIDTAIGGTGNDIFTLNADNDRIDGGGGTNTVVIAGSRANYALAFNNGTVTVTSQTGTIDTLLNIQTVRFNDAAVTVSCFVTGTRLQTEHGAVPVEALQLGDRLRTAAGALQPIIWIGRRTFDLTRHIDPDAVRPVRIAPHAFGPGLPTRHLLLSPDHAVFIDTVLIPARHLVNGTSITVSALEHFTYWHVELAQHDVILAENLPVESYLECGHRADFEGADVEDAHVEDAHVAGPNFTRNAMTIHPSFAAPCARMVSQGAVLEAVRVRLAG